MRLESKFSCKEDWNSFPKEGNKGFCAACSTHVVDFTAMTDAEVKAYFKNAKGKVCGRMRPDQFKYYPEPSSRLPYKAVAATLLGAALAGSPDESKAQSRTIGEVEMVQNTTCEKPGREADKGKFEVTGKVVDQQSVPVEGVRVGIKNTSIRTFTDAEGRFAFNTNMLDSRDTLQVSYHGSINTEVVLSGAHRQHDAGIITLPFHYQEKPFSKYTISGRVIMENGEAMIGASIVFSDSIGTVSDIDGTFTFTTNELYDRKLQIMFIGYETQEVSIPGGIQKTDMQDIIMKEDTTAVTEVMAGMVGMIISRPAPFYKRWWWKVKDLFSPNY